MLAHLGGPGGAVQADHVDAERLERGERGADLAAHEHRARGLDGHLDEDRQPDAGLGDRLLAAVDRGLGLQQVLRGLDEEGVGSAGMRPLGLLGEGRLEVGVGGVAEARQLGAGADRAEHPPHPAVGGLDGVDRLARDLGAGARRAPRCGPRCRSRRGSTSWRRTCWSRWRRCRSRGRRRGSARACRAGVTLRISLQPSSCWKSSRLGSTSCSIVPIAPSAITTRSFRVAISASERSGRTATGDVDRRVRCGFSGFRRHRLSLISARVGAPVAARAGARRRRGWSEAEREPVVGARRRLVRLAGGHADPPESG